MTDGIDERLRAHFDQLSNRALPAGVEESMLTPSARRRGARWVSLAVATASAAMLFAVLAISVGVRNLEGGSTAQTTQPGAAAGAQGRPSPSFHGGLPAGLAASYNDLGSENEWIFAAGGSPVCQSLVGNADPCVLIRTPATGHGYAAYGFILIEDQTMLFTITHDVRSDFVGRSRSCAGSTDVFDLTIAGDRVTLIGSQTNCLGPGFTLQRFG